MKKIEVCLKENSYSIIIKRNLKNNLAAYLKRIKLGNFGFILASQKIYNLYRPLIEKNFSRSEFKVIVCADGEKVKSKEWFFKVLNQMLDTGLNRKKPYLVCLGGGTIGDLGGFIASVYRRGINYVQVPTTLIGQIDSSIGGKTAIDLPQAKNIIGTFYQPKAVLIDPSFLDTLPDKDLKEGLAEAIKYGLIKDKKIFFLLKDNNQKILAKSPVLLNNLIYACAKIKADIVSRDEKEKKGLRTILNFGHTFAHGLETASGYKKVSHGKAVGIGMLYAACLSEHLKKTGPDTARKIAFLLKLFGFSLKVKFNSQEVLKAINYDKKFTQGRIRMVLIERIGKVSVSNRINQADLKKTVKKMNALIDFIE